MSKSAQQLHNEVNRAIIKCRGVYAAWSKAHNISYNTMLVLYTIREYGHCTQKQLCDSYRLPRQTMNNIFTGMRNDGILTVDKDLSCGREKAFVLTEQGSIYAENLLRSLNELEAKAAERMGEEKLCAMTKLVLEYDDIMAECLAESE